MAECSGNVVFIPGVKAMEQSEAVSPSAPILSPDEIGQIAIGVIQEIQNPFTVIKGYLQFFKNKPATCRRETRRLLFQEVERMETLLINFILLACDKETDRTRQNLNCLLQQIYPAVQMYAHRNNMVTEMFLSDRLPMIAFNAAEIKHLVMNLVYNGIEAMPAHGRLTVGTAYEHGRVVLFVRDEGSGIPPEEMGKIFNPFYTTKTGSSGLGLAASRSIVARHQGRIEIVANRRAGITVRVLFAENSGIVD